MRAPEGTYPGASRLRRRCAVGLRFAWAVGICLAVGAGPAPARAEGPGGALSYQGFTGLLNTPSADVTPWGRLDAVYTDHLEIRLRETYGGRVHNYMFSIGLLPFFEIGGRLADVPRIGQDRGMMDLSGSFKLQVPFLPDFLPRLALGVQDFAGKARHFQSAYVVASYSLGPLSVSLGHGWWPSPDDTPNRFRMLGVFGGAELRLLEGIHLLADWETEHLYFGFRFVSPDLYGMRLVVMGQTPVLAEHRGFELGVGLQLPLERHDAAPPRGVAEGEASGAAATSIPEAAADPVPAPETSPAPDTSPAPETPADPDTSPASEARLRALKRALVDLGFEHVRLGLRDGGVLFVVYEDQRHNVNALDGLGVVLGTVAWHAPCAIDEAMLVATRERIPVLETRASLAGYRAFLSGDGNGEDAAAALDVRAPQLRYDAAGTEWIAEDLEASRVLVRVGFFPLVTQFIGTEVGAFDFALALGVTGTVPLWRGAVLDSLFQVPILHSRNFRDGQRFDIFRPRGGLRDLFFHQTFRLAPEVLNMTSVGRYRFDHYGVFNETTWSPGTGVHGVRARLGYFATRDGLDVRPIWLGSYRYYLAPLNTVLQATYGQYWHQDRGVTLELAQLFDDVVVRLFYKYTGEHAGGLRLSLPLSPRRDGRPQAIQIRGAERWTTGLQTTMWREDGTNALDPRIAVAPVPTHNVYRAYLNHDRLNRAYVARHLPRLRDAWSRWGPGAEDAPACRP
jgi:hypothetical protein